MQGLAVVPWRPFWQPQGRGRLRIRVAASPWVRDVVGLPFARGSHAPHTRTVRDSEKGRESVRLTPALCCRHPPWSERGFGSLTGECPRQDSNLRTRLRRPLLYPLSYGGVSAAELLARGDG